MKTPARILSARAFTLVELLVVITIVALLVSISFTAYKGVMARARSTDALSTAKAVTNAIQNYNADYRRMPVRAGATEEPVDFTAGSPLLKVLLGDDVDRLNPKRIAFLSDPKLGKNGVGGLVGTDDQFALIDPWGTAYRVVMDSNWDSRVNNPDAQNEDPSIAAQASSWLPATVLAYSAGVDKKFGTRDDVVSWR